MIAGREGRDESGAETELGVRECKATSIHNGRPW